MMFNSYYLISWTLTEEFAPYFRNSLRPGYNLSWVEVQEAGR